MDRSTVTVGAWCVGVAAAGCAAFALAGAPWWLWVAGVLGIGAAVLPAVAPPSRGRRARLASITLVAIAVLVALVGPWLLVAQPVGRTSDVVANTLAPDRVRVVDDRVLVEVAGEVDLVVSGDTRPLDSGGGVGRLAAADGWLFVSDDRDGGVIAYDADGTRLFELGGVDPTDAEVRAVTADARRAVLLSCRDAGSGTCSAVSVDRTGRVAWTRPLGEGWRSSVPERAGSGTGADVPIDDEPWLVRPSQDDGGGPRRGSESVRLDPDDGSVVERRDDASVVRVGAAPRLEVSSPDGRCRTTAWRGEDRLWTRDLGPDACPDVYTSFATGPTAHVGGGVPLDLRTGRVLDRLAPELAGGAQPRLVAGSDPVALFGERGWVLDVATGRARWRFEGVDGAGDDSTGGEVEVVSSATTIAVVHDHLSWNPYVARRGFSRDPGQARMAQRVLMAPVGASGPAHSCVLDHAGAVWAVLGPDRLLVSDGSGDARAVTCR